MNLLVLFVFLSVLFFLLALILVFLLYDSYRKQKLYEDFSSGISESVIVFSQNMEFLYGLPVFMSDPLFKLLSSGRAFKDVLEPKSWSRLKLYFDNVVDHNEMPFVFSFDGGHGGGLIEKTEWYEIKAFVKRVSSREFNYVCFLKNISRENEFRKERERLNSELDLLLKNTGDFLWTFDVEDRTFRLLTPLTDDEHHMIPLSAGNVDVQSLLLGVDYENLNNVLNRRIQNYRNFGSKGDPYETISVRMYGRNNTLLWYGLRGTLAHDENNRLVFQGAARRMVNIFERSDTETSNTVDFFKAAHGFPDVRLFSMNTDYVVTGCNQAFATDFQFFEVSEVVGKQIQSVVNKKFLVPFMKIVTDVLESRRCASWKGKINSQGRLLLFNIVPVDFESNRVRKVLCFYTSLCEKDFIEEL